MDDIETTRTVKGYRNIYKGDYKILKDIFKINYKNPKKLEDDIKKLKEKFEPKLVSRPHSSFETPFPPRGTGKWMRDVEPKMQETIFWKTRRTKDQGDPGAVLIMPESFDKRPDPTEEEKEEMLKLVAISQKELIRKRDKARRTLFIYLFYKNRTINSQKTFKQLIEDIPKNLIPLDIEIDKRRSFFRPFLHKADELYKLRQGDNPEFKKFIKLYDIQKTLSGGWVAIYNENDKIYYFNLNTFNSTTNKEKTVPEEQTTSAAALASVRDALRLAMDDHATISNADNDPATISNADNEPTNISKADNAPVSFSNADNDPAYISNADNDWVNSNVPIAVSNRRRAGRPLVGKPTVLDGKGENENPLQPSIYENGVHNANSPEEWAHLENLRRGIEGGEQGVLIPAIEHPLHSGSTNEFGLPLAPRVRFPEPGSTVERVVKIPKVGSKKPKRLSGRVQSLTAQEAAAAALARGTVTRTQAGILTAADKKKAAAAARAAEIEAAKQAKLVAPFQQGGRRRKTQKRKKRRRRRTLKRI